MQLVTVEDVIKRLPSDAEVDSVERLELIIADSFEAIELEFADCGRDLNTELTANPALQKRVAIVIREMTGALVIAGARKGIRSVTSTTGPTSDATTYSGDDYTGWTRAFLTAEQRDFLGLCSGGARGSFPRALRWPERVLYGYSR